MSSIEVPNSQKKSQFSMFFIIYKMIHGYPINVLLEKDDKYLEPVLEKLSQMSYLETEVHYYQLTALGREVYHRFMKRYTDFLVNFDVYCAVDLSNGEFAFEKFWKIEEEAIWKRYIDQDRFDDLRIVVAKFKQLDPEEIIFMSFLNENRFDQATARVGWQFDLASGQLWNEIDEIVLNSIKEEQLGYQDEQGDVPGNMVLADVIQAGAELNRILWQDAQKYFKEEYDGLEIDQDALQAYSDKNYLNPIWKEKLF